MLKRTSLVVLTMLFLPGFVRHLCLCKIYFKFYDDFSHHDEPKFFGHRHFYFSHHLTIFSYFVFNQLTVTCYSTILQFSLGNSWRVTWSSLIIAILPGVMQNRKVPSYLPSVWLYVLCYSPFENDNICLTNISSSMSLSLLTSAY